MTFVSPIDDGLYPAATLGRPELKYADYPDPPSKSGCRPLPAIENLIPKQNTQAGFRNLHYADHQTDLGDALALPLHNGKRIIRIQVSSHSPQHLRLPRKLPIISAFFGTAMPIIPTNKTVAPIRKKKMPLFAVLACMALPCLLGGCGSLISRGMVLEHVVAYPAHSPEFAMRDLGRDRYLLGQWDAPLNANERLRMRYFDRRANILTPLPDEVTVVRKKNGTVLGALRYESDSPLQIAFFDTRYTDYDSSCEYPTQPAAGNSPKRLCGHIGIVLSLDGGRSFVWRRVRIPAALGRHITPDKYEFAIVRNNTLYLGLYLNSIFFPGVCCDSADGKSLVDRKGIAYARRFKGKAVENEGSDVFLSVLAMPLPGDGGTPLSSKQIPDLLSADVLIGQALVDFDLGQPMARLESPPPVPVLGPPRRQYQRSDRQAYIESLRAEYPEWAAHQTLDDIPRKQQLMTSAEINAMREKQTRRGYDPIEWVRFDRPIVK